MRLEQRHPRPRRLLSHSWAAESRQPWLGISVSLLIVAFGVCAEARLFTDLSDEEIAPRDYDLCQTLPISECLSEFQTGRFDGAQNHRSLPVADETAAMLRPSKTKLLMLITTIWRNFQRRRLLRNALARCSLLTEDSSLPSQSVWRFLMGKVPPHLLPRAKAEAMAHDDLLLLDSDDEIKYSHVGDAYELTGANPELVKMTLALRLLFGSLDFEYLMVIDDDSFVSLPNALELLKLVPSERVYIGNMIDSVPQRFSNGRIRPEYSVNIYMHAPSKVPVFAHGMGFVVSRDVAKLIAEMGLSLKSRGNDDMLQGLWFRSIEHLHYLHYWPWFLDHEDFGGAFTRPCDDSAVIIHRMNAERWRRFSVMECSVCGPPQGPLDEDDTGESEGLEGLAGTVPGEGLADISASPVKDLRSCISKEEVACSWRPASLEDAFRSGTGTCLSRCKREATINGTSQRCPPSLCHALCMPGGEGNSLCPPRSDHYPRALPHVSTKNVPQLAILIFGSAWADTRLRSHLRSSLSSCTSRRLGIHAVPHVFAMPALPSVGNPLRGSAVAEILEKRDLAVLKLAEEKSVSANATYAYTEAWRIAEERFGGAEYLLLADHRSFINVPFIVHVVLPRLDRTAVYVGCLMDETTMGSCTGKGITRCDYLWRRRAPLYAHGMGFIVSADVARQVSKMASTIPLREADVPSDVAFGMWVQPLENLVYESVHSHFHLWPVEAGEKDKFHISLPITSSSAIVFPMTTRRWRRFDARTCMLSNNNEVFEAQMPDDLDLQHMPGSETPWSKETINASPSGQAQPTTTESEGKLAAENTRLVEENARLAAENTKVLEENRRLAAELEKTRLTSTVEAMSLSSPLQASSAAEAAQLVVDECWRGMGGRPEAWHLVCCEMHYDGCWGGDYTEEYCCRHAPGASITAAAASKGFGGNATAGLEVIRDFLGFDSKETNLLIAGLEEAASESLAEKVGGNASEAGSDAAPVQRFGCLSPKDCAQEAFARFYQRAWATKILPLRHPWITNVQDHLFGIAVKLRNENDGWGPRGHEHTFERVQLAHWLQLAADNIVPEEVPGERRCLEWDSSQYSRHFFSKHCSQFDVLTYGGTIATVDVVGNGAKRYMVDIHNAREVMEENSISLVVCAQIFEHLRRPHVAMEELFRFVAHGGFVVWSAPMFSEIHGAPEDFYRYTPLGAKAMAEDAGFQVVGQYSPGGLREMAGYLLGMTAPYWPKEDILHDSGSSWPLQVYMILLKP